MTAVRQKVEQFLNAARTGNLDLFKSKVWTPFLRILPPVKLFAKLGYLNFGFGLKTELAAQLDDGNGLAQTVTDVKDANKRGALHFAAREGQTEVCKYLVEELKLNVDTKDEDGNTRI